MAIAQRMRQPVPPPVLVVIGVVALVLGGAALVYGWMSSAGPAGVPYSQLLSDVEMDPDLEGDLRLLDGEGGQPIEITANGMVLKDVLKRQGWLT